jgi:hypothetical protein
MNKLTEARAWELRKGATDRVLIEITNNPSLAYDWSCSLEEIVPLYSWETVEAAVLAEREACATLVENLLGENPDLSEVYVAAEIRARGQG